MTAAMKALVALEDRAQRYETALLQIMEAQTLAAAYATARQAISEAHFGPSDERGGAA